MPQRRHTRTRSSITQCPRSAAPYTVRLHDVELWFTQELEPAFSTARVLDQASHRQDKADAKVDPHNATLLQVSLPPLAPGRYRVEWRVISVDTHVTEGDFTFVVAP